MRRALVALLAVAALTSAPLAGEFYTKDKNNKERGEPTEDMALVYVFRPAMAGGAIKTWAFADDQLIGVFKGKAYSFALVPPGERILWSKAENTSAIEMEIAAGETYYLKQSIRMGIGKARVKMVEVTEADAEKFFKKCGYAEPTEAGQQRAAEIAANRMDRAEDKAAKRKKREGN